MFLFHKMIIYYVKTKQEINEQNKNISNPKILVTGGLGYIGSHTVVELLEKNYDVVVVDNLSNSKLDVVERIKLITNKDFKFYKEDVCDYHALKQIFSEHKFDCVIHFAGYKSVAESIKNPIMYYENNIISILNLCKIMQESGCNKLIFSSSATVYGIPKSLPLTEESEIGKTTNPYGTTKYMVERILNDITISNPNFTAIVLRYFNPIGAHKSGLIGENPNGIPNNLMPYIVRVATGKFKILNIFGNDYNTPDGTGVRDYIHVVDIARGHIKAIEKAQHSKGFLCYNLGIGQGYSVLDLVKCFERVNHVHIPYKIEERRPGDIDSSYASIEKATKELNWKAEYSLDDMLKDSFNFIRNLKS